MLFCLPIVLITTILIQCDAEDKGINAEFSSGYKIGHFQIVNYNDEGMLVNKVSHLIRNDPSNKHGTTIYDIPIKGRKVSTAFQFHYKTGWLWNAGFDYWYIKVTYGGQSWDTKSNFFCNIAPEDENGTVSLVLKMNPGELTVKPPKSSKCVAWLWSWRWRG